MTPPLAPGLFDVPPGMVATVVTHLEMTQRPPLRDVAADVPNVVLVPEIGVADYRDIYARVGAHNWLWFSRMQMSDTDLAAILDDSDMRVATMLVEGRPEALLELDFRQQGACELAFFGVSSRLLGKGAGRALMNEAIRLAWDRPIRRFHVHTCTLDHPGALSFYRRSGFTPIRQQIEIAPDPRLAGVLPTEAGPHIPIFDP
ncbi:GNAT family N-acetyltransferase [Aestuariivita sp.]|uniref:GNAT family N-acetyltransferase n=1 Tax=Aestuariivita sp. TaxID=1872407 RepID=UPI0025C0886F|nr:GNAT family N-acetyltransferase [Aestuariivita sp.]